MEARVVRLGGRALLDLQTRRVRLGGRALFDKQHEVPRCPESKVGSRAGAPLRGWGVSDVNEPGPAAGASGFRIKCIFFVGLRRSKQETATGRKSSTR